METKINSEKKVYNDEEVKRIRNQLIITMRGLQIISYIIIITCMVVIWQPATVWGLIISIVLLLLYIMKIDKKLKEKNNE